MRSHTISKKPRRVVTDEYPTLNQLSERISIIVQVLRFCTSVQFQLFIQIQVPKLE